MKKKKHAMGGSANLYGEALKGGLSILEAIINDPSKSYTNQPTYNANTMKGMVNPYQNFALGGEIGEGDETPQAPKGYKASTLQQRTDWNNFLDYLGTEKLQGSKELDKRDQNLWTSSFKKFKKANPNITIDESFVPIAQYEGALLRSDSEVPGVASKQVVNNFNKVLGDPWKKNISPIDSWVGSITSQMYYPQHKGERNVPSFGMDYDAYNQYISTAGNNAKFAMGGEIEENVYAAAGGMGLAPADLMDMINGSLVPIEAEGGEVVEFPTGGVAKLRGASHESGGIDINVPTGTKIYSDRLKIGGKTMQQRKLAREKKLSKLDKLLSDGYNSNLLYNTIDRSRHSIDKEDAMDMRIQEIANTIYNAPHAQEFALGGYADEYEIDPVTMRTTDNVSIGAPAILAGFDWNTLKVPTAPDEQAAVSNDPGFGVGDYVGLAGNLFGAIAPIINTLKNAAANKPNTNKFKNFGVDALNTNTDMQEYVDTQRSTALDDVEIAANTGYARNRNSASSVNTVRALDTITDMARNKGRVQVNSNFDRMMGDILGQRTQLQNTRDQMVMTGEERRAMEDKADTDNFYSNMAENLANASTNVQAIGRSLNTARSNKVDATLLGQLSKYGLSFDKDGNLISTR